MALTPNDVTQKTFRPQWRGYNADEVDSFLDEVIASIEEYDERLQSARRKIALFEEQNRAKDEACR